MAYVLLKAVETQITATFTHISAAFKDAISSSVNNIDASFS
jgi:3-dehydroquinate dehydratase